MNGFENHLSLPRHSEEHNRMLGSLVELQNRLDDRTAAKIIDQGNSDIVDRFFRLSFNVDGSVTLRPSPEDPDYSPDSMPDPLADEEMGALIHAAEKALSRAEADS